MASASLEPDIKRVLFQQMPASGHGGALTTNGCFGHIRGLKLEDLSVCPPVVLSAASEDCDTKTKV